MSLSSDRRHRLLLAGIVGLTILLPLCFFLGPRTIDHFLTTGYAWQMLHHEFHPTSWPQSTRFGLLLPMALLQWTFGVGPASAAALTIAFSAVHVLAVYLLTRALFSPDAALVAAAISALLPLETLQATLLYPDLPAAALATAGLAILIAEVRQERPRLRFLILAGSFFAGSYLIKQTVVFHLLFVGGWVALRKHWSVWPAAIPIVFTIAVETTCLAAMTGDPAFRQTHVNRFVADKNYDEYFHSMGVADLSTRFLSELFNPLDRAFPYLIGIAGIYGALSWRSRAEPPVRFLFVLWLILLVLTTFWPVRWSPFVPALVTDGRHLVPMIAPMAAVVGAAFVRLPDRQRLALGIAFTAACLLATALTHQYLAKEDAGDRVAYGVLKAKGATRIRATDIHGNGPELLKFLSGYDPRIDIRAYRPEDLQQMKAEWIVVNDRTPLSRELRIPASWDCVWKQHFPVRWDPRSLVTGAPREPDYEVRIYRAP